MKSMVSTCSALLLALVATPAFAQRQNAAATPAPASSSAPAAAAKPAPSASQNPYRINAGDELEIFVWGEERLQRSVRVLPDGTFSFPLVGKVDALNALPSDIEARITKGLESQYRTAVPQVTVSVKSPSGLAFSVLGKVRGPGTFTPGRYVNVVEAISFAGGPSDFAQLNNVVIVRKTATGTQSIRVRLGDLMKGQPGDLSTNAFPLIQGGDTVIVP